MKMIYALPLMFATHAAADPVTERSWQYLSDRVMGGVSDGTARMVDGTIHMTGTVSTANNGGFIQVRTPLPSIGIPGDGLTLRVKGNGEEYFVHLRTQSTRRPWEYYRASFVAAQDWADVTLTWADFTPARNTMPDQMDPDQIVSLGLVAYGRDFQADLWIAAVGPVVLP